MLNKIKQLVPEENKLDAVPPMSDKKFLEWQWKYGENKFREKVISKLESELPKIIKEENAKHKFTRVIRKIKSLTE